MRAKDTGRGGDQHKRSDAYGCSKNREWYFSKGHKLECGQVEWTPGEGNRGLGLLFNGDAILERAVLDEVLSLLTLKHFFAFHFELEWGLSTRYWVTIAIQYWALLGLPTTTAGSFAHEAGTTKRVGIQLAI